MLTRGIWALWERSLRIDARLIVPNLLRAGVLLVVYASLLSIVNSRWMLGAPGLIYFSTLAYCNVILITALGFRLFASALTEEKEDGTLPLLLLTGLDPLVILLGKSSSRLLQMSLLLVVQFPAWLFAVTLGGVTLGQVFAVAVALAAYLVCIANVGLLMSVLARRTGDAAAAMVVLSCIYCIFPPVGVQLALDLQINGSEWIAPPIIPYIVATLHWIGEQSVFVRLHEVLQSGFAGGPLCWQVVSNSLFGVAMFGLAWMVFPWATANLDQEAPARRLVGQSTAATRNSLWTAGRAWQNALAWQSYQFDAGGRMGIFLKLCGFAAVCLFVTWMHTEQFQRVVPIQEVFAGWAIALTLLLYFELMIQGSRIFQNEYKQKTWSTLLILPRSVPYLAYSKVGGILLSMLPGFVACLLCWVLTYLTSYRPENPFRELEFWFTVSLGLFVLNLVTWLSTYRVSSHAAARAMAVIAAFVGLLIVCANVNFRQWGISDEQLLVAWMCLFLLSIPGMLWSMGLQLAKDDSAAA